MASPRWRVVVDNDYAGDPDGLVALAHLLLTDDLAVELITCTPVDPGLARLAGMDAATSTQEAVARATELLDAMGGDRPPVLPGPTSFEGPQHISPAARAIIDACLSDSEVPLALLCGGPLTTIAQAIEAEPSICSRAVLVWIGGSREHAAEYNRDTDPAAAATVFASTMPLVQVPLETYALNRVSVAEVSVDLARSSALGGWLAQRLLDLPPFVTLHGSLTLGDSVLAAVVALDAGLTTSIGSEGSRRRVDDVDTRLIWGDLLAKLRGGERP